MSEPLARLVETWHQACADFVALVRDLSEDEGELPTDLSGWSVRDNVAHTAHLEAVLAGAPEETLEVPRAEHLRGPMSYYTEQGVLARREHDLARLADEIESSVRTRHAALQADPPTDPSALAEKTPGGVPWTVGTLLSNRPLDVWMHEQDVRRAVDRPGGYDSPAALHTIETLAAGLPMVVGKRVSPPAGTTVRLEVPDAGLTRTVRVGEDGRASLLDGADGPNSSNGPDCEPTTTLRLSAEDFVVLAGGRRTPEQTTASIEGDEELGQRVLESLAITP